jgi:hypothetical protein
MIPRFTLVLFAAVLVQQSLYAANPIVTMCLLPIQLHLFTRTLCISTRVMTRRHVELLWSEAGLSGNREVRDLWLHRDLGSFNEKFSVSVPGHGAVLLGVK